MFYIIEHGERYFCFLNAVWTVCYPSTWEFSILHWRLWQGWVQTVRKAKLEDVQLWWSCVKIVCTQSWKLFNQRLAMGITQTTDWWDQDGFPHTKTWSWIIMDSKVVRSRSLMILCLLTVSVYALIEEIIVWYFVVIKIIK